MASKKEIEKPKTGRPLKQIEQKPFENLCGLQCTLEEIAGFFECSADTIERWCARTYDRRFADVYAEKRGAGKISLRRSQFALAQKNAAMAIFLGRNYLGQKNQDYDDNPEETRKMIEQIVKAVRDVE